MTAFLALAFASATVAAPSTDVDAAMAWLRLVDAGQWDESWSAAGALFTGHVAKADWTAKISPVRAPLGRIVSRTIASVTKTATLPGAPDGEYEVIQFTTSFANKAGATETVVLAREAGGWKVDGYFIR